MPLNTPQKEKPEELYGLPGYDHRDRSKGKIKHNRWLPDQDEDGRFLRDGRRFDYRDGEAFFVGAFFVFMIIFALITWILRHVQSVGHNAVHSVPIY